jgi:hypothetical protein
VGTTTRETTMTLDTPLTGHSVHHDVLNTFVDSRVPSVAGVLLLRTTVTNGVPSRTAITQPGSARVTTDVSELNHLAVYVQAHEQNVAAVVDHHQAALAALGESWALDASGDPEHVEVGA